LLHGAAPSAKFNTVATDRRDATEPRTCTQFQQYAAHFESFGETMVPLKPKSEAEIDCAFDDI
jgi:hypothetical protein